MKNHFLKFLSIFSYKADKLPQKIVAKDKNHLQQLIRKEINRQGDRANLNHIDTSNITDMSHLFQRTTFKGDISEWNVSNVVNMFAMFRQSEFDGDISKWDVSNVVSMHSMFKEPWFDKDISNWKISNLERMGEMFKYSDFSHDLSNWRPYKLFQDHEAFSNCHAVVPWFIHYSKEERQRFFDLEKLNAELNNGLKVNDKLTKRMKI